jgi:hypothetical protein
LTFAFELAAGCVANVKSAPLEPSTEPIAPRELGRLLPRMRQNRVLSRQFYASGLIRCGGSKPAATAMRWIASTSMKVRRWRGCRRLEAHRHPHQRPRACDGTKTVAPVVAWINGALLSRRLVPESHTIQSLRRAARTRICRIKKRTPAGGTGVLAIGATCDPGGETAHASSDRYSLVAVARLPGCDGGHTKHVCFDKRAMPKRKTPARWPGFSRDVRCGELGSPASNALLTWSGLARPRPAPAAAVAAAHRPAAARRRPGPRRLPSCSGR